MFIAEITVAMTSSAFSLEPAFWEGKSVHVHVHVHVNEHVHVDVDVHASTPLLMSCSYHSTCT